MLSKKYALKLCDSWGRKYMQGEKILTCSDNTACYVTGWICLGMHKRRYSGNESYAEEFLYMF